MIQGMSEICIDCIHQEVCRYECHCPSEHCNDRAVADDFIPQGEWIISQTMNCHSDIINVYTCPFCGEKEYIAYPYCHCGAKLGEGGVESEQL